MTGYELLPHIKSQGRGDRFSENLAKWVRKRKEWPITAALSRHSIIDGGEVDYDPALTQAHQILIGHSDDCYFSGNRLSRILGGAKDQFAFPLHGFRIIELPEWWEGYIKGGKCFIDPQHRIYMDAERWKIARDGQSRVCQWCGNHTQEKHIETREYVTWRSRL